MQVFRVLRKCISSLSSICVFFLSISVCSSKYLQVQTQKLSTNALKSVLPELKRVPHLCRKLSSSWKETCRTSAASVELILSALVGMASVNWGVKMQLWLLLTGKSAIKKQPETSTYLNNVHIKSNASFLVVVIDMRSVYSQDFLCRNSELFLGTENDKAGVIYRPPGSDSNRTKVSIQILSVFYSFRQSLEDETSRCVLTFQFSSSLLFAFVTHSVNSSRSIFFVTSTPWEWSWPNISRLEIRNRIRTFTLTGLWFEYYRRILLIRSRSRIKASLLLFHPWKCSFVSIYLRYDCWTQVIKMKRLRVSFVFCRRSSRKLNIWLW